MLSVECKKKLRLKIGLVPEVVTLNEELVLLDGVGFTVLQMDYGSRHCGQTLDDDFGYLLPEELQLIVHRGLVRDTCPCGCWLQVAYHSFRLSPP